MSATSASAATSRVALIGFADDSTWHPDGVEAEVIERQPRSVRLRVPRTTDPTALLAAANASGRVVEFSFGPPDLSEVFLESIGRHPGERAEVVE